MTGKCVYCGKIAEVSVKTEHGKTAKGITVYRIKPHLNPGGRPCRYAGVGVPKELISK